MLELYQQTQSFRQRNCRVAHAYKGGKAARNHSAFLYLHVLLRYIIYVTAMLTCVYLVRRKRSKVYLLKLSHFPQ